MIGWTGEVPWAGKGLYRAVSAIVKPLAPIVMSTTGVQFFLMDAEEGSIPLLVRDLIIL